MNKQWWHDAVVYQIYPKSFYDANDDGIGDIKGVIEKLDYLADLGVTIIWLCPVYMSPMIDNGYDISDYYQMASEFGTMEDIDNLIEEAKRRNIKILMDLVVNHTSDQHPWFLESKSSLINPKRDWYIWRDPKPNGEEPTNWGSVFGGSAWEYEKETEQYYLHVFAKEQPDLNWENPTIRKEIFKMINWWLDKGIGGFRVDAITYIKKNQGYPDIVQPGTEYPSISKESLNQKGIEDFLGELFTNTFAKYDIVTVAEAPGVPIHEIPKYVGENGPFSMLMEFDHVDIDLGPSKKWIKPNEWNLLDLKKVIHKSQKEKDNIWGAIYLENHDHVRSIDKFIQNDSVAGAKMLAAFYFFLKGVPFIYQGQEIGMRNVKYSSIQEYDDIASIDQYYSAMREGYSEEESLRAIWRRSRDNARTPMQWNDSEHAGFSKGTPWLKVNENYTSINLTSAIKDPRSVFHFYKELIKIRRKSPYASTIVYGDYQPILEDHSSIFAYLRSFGNQRILVIGNFYDTTLEQELDLTIKTVILSNYSNTIQKGITLTLRPYEVIICEILS